MIGLAVCYAVSEICIDFEASRITYGYCDGRTTLFPGGLDDFARTDGFPNWAAMLSFWQLHHPLLPVFYGVLIRWREFRPGGGLGA